jgi:hypothetical protein
LRLFQKKKSVFCNICSKELKYKYKPATEWNIEGFLCADCHIDKTKEFSAIQQQYDKEILDNCIICKKELKSESEKRKPLRKWSMDSGSFLCSDCFEKIELSYEKRLNFCSICSKKMGFIRYNPKPKWKIDGQLCKNCWDSRNHKEIPQ